MKKELSKNILEVVDILSSFGTKYYIQSGYAVTLQTGKQIKSNLDDVDIRVRMPELWPLYEFLEQESEKFEIRDLKMRGPMVYPKQKFENFCIEFRKKIDFDITSSLVTECNDIGRIVFPNSEEWFDEVDEVEVDGVKLRIANVNVLIFYYLIHRRGKLEGKDDIPNIKLLCENPKFSKQGFIDFLDKYLKNGKKSKLLQLASEYGVI